MALDKLVDSTQLDADLTSVANAIRTKGGASASLAFPADFVSAIAAIPSGGGTDYLEEALANTLTSYSNATLESIRQFGFYQCSHLASVSFPSVTSIGAQAFRYTKITQINRANFPLLTSFNDQAFQNCTSLLTVSLPGRVGISSNAFNSCSALTVAVLGGNGGAVSSSAFNGCASLAAADFGNISKINAQAFINCSSLITIVIRKTSVIGLDNINAFNNTPFKSGGTGGTIYIPKALYDHLGDGTSLDYKAATNWSTINGYGTITWAKIEGSQYENYYADGTPIT